MMVARKVAAAKETAKPAGRAAPAKKAAAPAAKAATKAAPARASKRTSTVEDEEPDLLAAMNDTSTKAASADDDEDFDLLSELTESSDGESWIPWDDEDQPEGIQGKVLAIGEVDREQKYGGGTAIMLQIADKSDPEQIWSVRGYATVLANQLEREIEKGLSVGDTIAIRYWGEKENKKGDNSYKNFTTASKSRR